MDIVYPEGEQIVTLAANDKLAVSSYDVTQIAQLIRNPNQPDAWSVFYTTQPGANYTTDAFASGAVLKISAFAAPVLFDVGANPSIPTLESLSDDIDDINEEIETINEAIDQIESNLIVTKYRSNQIQTVSSANTDTLIKFNTYESGSNTIYNPSTGLLTPTRSGLYLIGVSVTLSGVGDGEYMNAKIYKNGVSTSFTGIRVGSSASPSSVGCSDVLAMNGTTDTVSFYIRSDNASAATAGNPGDNFFYAIRVADI